MKTNFSTIILAVLATTGVVSLTSNPLSGAAQQGFSPYGKNINAGLNMKAIVSGFHQHTTVNPETVYTVPQGNSLILVGTATEDPKGDSYVLKALTGQQHHLRKWNYSYQTSIPHHAEFAFPGFRLDSGDQLLIRAVNGSGASSWYGYLIPSN